MIMMMMMSSPNQRVHSCASSSSWCAPSPSLSPLSSQNPPCNPATLLIKQMTNMNKQFNVKKRTDKNL
uniref:Uncharacterized protein n=1 Tax=Arundo donax TaxID=35708 RepID=A0A0A9D9Z7_ARUDO